MARGCMISPKFFSDEKLSQVSLEARLTFVGLLVFSDKFGVVRGHTKWLRSRIFPYDDVSAEEFEKYIIELTGIDVIQQFIERGEQYLRLKHFPATKQSNVINRTGAV